MKDKEKKVLTKEEKIQLKKEKKQKDKADKVSYILYPLAFVVFAVIIEVVGFISLGLNAFPKYFMLDFGIILILAGIIFIVPSKKAKKILLYTFLGIATFLNCVNACLYKVFGDIFYFKLIFLMEETVTVFDLSYLDIPKILTNIAVYVILILTVKFFEKKLSSQQNIGMVQKIAVVLALFFSIEVAGFSSFLITQNNLSTVSAQSETYVADSDSYLYDNLDIKMKSYQTFGFYGFYSKEIYNSIANLFVPELSYKKALKLTEFLDAGKVGANPNATLKDDNLIMIMCESLEWFAIDPIFTPNLYYLFYGDDSVKLVNYYSKHKTNVSEDISILGNMPKDYDLKDFISLNGLNTPYSIPNLFKNSGAESVKYFHTYTSKFYNREKVNKKLGFEDIITINDVDVGYNATGWKDFASEQDYVKEIINELAPTDKKFMSFYTTVKMHGDYGGVFSHLEDEHNLLKNEQLYQDFLDWNNSYTTFKIPKKGSQSYKYFMNYKAAAIDLDRAVAFIMEHLKNNNLDNNTSLVLFSDHNAYINGLSSTLKDIDIKDTYNSAQYKVPCVIYNKKLEGKIIDYYTNVYDLYPTICALYGLPYNKSLTQGYDIFSEEIKDSITISYICGIFTDKLFSRDISNVYVCTGRYATQEEIYNFKVNASKFYLKQNTIDEIYKYNFLKYYEI